MKEKWYLNNGIIRKREAIEAAYEKNLGIAPKKRYTPSSTTGAGKREA